MTINISKQRYDAIVGILDSRNRRLDDEERDALEYARGQLALEIADGIDDPKAAEQVTP